MKQLKVLVALVFAAAVSAPAMAAPTVTFDGSANARFGMQYMAVDGSDQWSNIVLSGLSGSNDLATELGTFGTALVTDVATAYTIYSMGGAAPSAEQVAIYSALTTLGMAADFSNAEAILGANPSFLFAQGFKSKKAAEKTFVGLKNESAVLLGANVVSENKKLTARVAAKFGSSTDTDTAGNTYNKPVDLQDAWIQYDFGMLAIKYNTFGMNNRWDGDILYVGTYTGENSLDFQIKPADKVGYAFVTIMSDTGFDGVKYENTEMRQIPMFAAGYAYESDMIDATIGGVYDKPTKDGGDYTGYLGFAGATYKMGKIGAEVGSLVVGLNGVYGKNVARFAGMNPADMEQATLGVHDDLDQVMIDAATETPFKLTYNQIEKGDKDSTVYGGRLFAAYTAWTGGIISVDGRYSSCTLNGSDPFTAYRVTGGVTQAFSENFFVTLGGGYEAYSVAADDKAADKAWGYETTIDCAYKF